MTVSRRNARRGMLAVLLLAGGFFAGAVAVEETDDPVTKWRRGEGWGAIWGEDDEVGALNAMSPASVIAALRLAETGRIYDLGVPFDRESFRWPGHSPTEVMTFRSPHGIRAQRDLAFTDDAAQTTWHSCALFINDNVGTQLDGLGHLVTGPERRWYNGFREAEWGGDFGVRRCDATTIPPIVARGVLLDVAGAKGVEALPASHGITVDELEETLARQETALRPGDVVLVRTGTLGAWGENGADHEALAARDSAGLTMAAARWLVEEHGAMIVGSDTSGLEVSPAEADADSFIPVHEYLLVDQGVHIGELHSLEELARDRAYEFCYVALVNPIRGATAGFCLRPIAIR